MCGCFLPGATLLIKKVIAFNYSFTWLFNREECDGGGEKQNQHRVKNIKTKNKIFRCEDIVVIAAMVIILSLLGFSLWTIIIFEIMPDIENRELRIKRHYRGLRGFLNIFLFQSNYYAFRGTEGIPLEKYDISGNN